MTNLVNRENNFPMSDTQIASKKDNKKKQRCVEGNWSQL